MNSAVAWERKKLSFTGSHSLPRARRAISRWRGAVPPGLEATGGSTADQTFFEQHPKLTRKLLGDWVLNSSRFRSSARLEVSVPRFLVLRLYSVAGYDWHGKTDRGLEGQFRWNSASKSRVRYLPPAWVSFFPLPCLWRSTDSFVPRTAVSSNMGSLGLSGFGWTFLGKWSVITSA